MPYPSGPSAPGYPPAMAGYPAPASAGYPAPARVNGDLRRQAYLSYGIPVA